MERTTISGDKIRLGDIELTNIMKSLIKGYRFLHGNNSPKSITIPNITKVEDVTIIYEKAEVKRGKTE